MRKITKSHILLQTVAKERYIVSDPFFRLFESAKDVLAEDVFNHVGSWSRSFYIAAARGYVVSVDCQGYGGLISGIFEYGIENMGVRRERFSAGLKDNLDPALQLALMLCRFMDVAEVYEEVVEPKKSARIGKEKIQNKTLLGIKNLTISYLKTSIRDAPVEVQGHWRWQAHGKNMSKRKLKYIMPHTRKGYTKKAKKHSRESSS